MLSVRDCLDYCDLTEDDVALVAEHEQISDNIALQLVCSLVQTPEGVLALSMSMEEMIESAARIGDHAKAERAARVYAHFSRRHPVVN